jgi:PHD/YefM family antitoxin component YafN of YafNO toxin-antitoxin module
MLDVSQLEISYVTNKAGDKTAVILSIEEFQELMEDIADLAAVAERRDEPTIPHEQLLVELKEDGLLQD